MRFPMSSFDARAAECEVGLVIGDGEYWIPMPEVNPLNC